MIISPAFFFFNFIKILIFQDFRGGWGLREKYTPQKSLSGAPYIWGTIHHMIIICGTQV